MATKNNWVVKWQGRYYRLTSESPDSNWVFGSLSKADRLTERSARAIAAEFGSCFEAKCLDELQGPEQTKKTDQNDKKNTGNP